MEDNISYGWKELSGHIHLRNMENIRTLYCTSSLEDTLENKCGTCVEQALLMKYLLNKIGIETNLFCARIYGDETIVDASKDVHMHCFVLYNLNGKIYHMEYSNYKTKGIREYNSFEDAINTIKSYYEKIDNGTVREITEFSTVDSGLSFKELNLYINSLDKEKDSKRKIIKK